MHYQLIETQNQLNTFVEQIKNKPVLAIDTEFMRRRTLYPEVALIQVYDGEHLALIDPLAELSLFDFWQILKDPAVLKVFHSPSEDIEVFQKYAVIRYSICTANFRRRKLHGLCPSGKNLTGY